VSPSSEVHSYKGVIYDRVGDSDVKAEAIGKSRTTVQNAVKELQDKDLLEKKAQGKIAVGLSIGE